MEMQRRGAKQRQKAATALNYHSSRSHSVFTVSLGLYADGVLQSDSIPAGMYDIIERHLLGY